MSIHLLYLLVIKVPPLMPKSGINFGDLDLLLFALNIQRSDILLFELTKFCCFFAIDESVHKLALPLLEGVA